VIGLGRLRRVPLYGLDATRARLDAHGFVTHEANGVQLAAYDADGEATFLLFFESTKAAERHALPPFAHMPSGIGPDVHRNVVVSSLAPSKNAVVDCLRAGVGSQPAS